MHPNEQVLLKPTEAGWMEIRSFVDRANAEMRTKVPDYHLEMPKPDERGFIKDQFYRLMAYFDWSKGAGYSIPFTDLAKAER